MSKINTIQELAEYLDGKTISNFTSRQESIKIGKIAKNKGWVLIFIDAVDDLIMQGAIEDHVEAYNETTMYFANGIYVSLESEYFDDIDEQIEFLRKYNPLVTNNYIKVIWTGCCPMWTFETQIEHHKFMLKDEDGNNFCEGILIGIENIS